MFIIKILHSVTRLATVALIALIAEASPSYAEFSATELATMCGGVTSESFTAEGGTIAYDANGVRIVGAEGQVRIENEGGVLLAKIENYTAGDYNECLVKMRSLDLDALLVANRPEELKWDRNLNNLIGSPDGNVPVVRKDLALNAQGAPYNSSKLTEIIFTDLSCEIEVWVDKIVVPDRPNGVGGVGLNEAALPDDTIQVGPGTGGIAINFHSMLVSDGFARQQRIALDAGDQDFAVTAMAFKRSYPDWSSTENVWISLAMAAPSEGCKGGFLTRHPVSRFDLENSRLNGIDGFQ